MPYTQNVVVECITLLLRFREVPGSNLGPKRPAILIEGFVVFLSPSTRMPGYYLKRPRQLPTKSFPIHYHSLITLSSTLYTLVTEKAS
jgi:hypothetical protein